MSTYLFTKLVETFKELYGDTFVYQGNRALVFELNQTVPVKEQKRGIKSRLRKSCKREVNSR